MFPGGSQIQTCASSLPNNSSTSSFQRHTFEFVCLLKLQRAYTCIRKEQKWALLCYWGHILKRYLAPAGHPVFCEISKLTNWSKNKSTLCVDFRKLWNILFTVNIWWHFKMSTLANAISQAYLEFESENDL